MNTTTSLVKAQGVRSRPTKEQFALLANWLDQALTQMPYFAPILLNLRAVNAPGLGTFAVDDQMRLYIDFEAVRKHGDQWCYESLLHECGHIWNDHSGRAQDMSIPREFVKRRDWNYACDFAINDDLVQVGCTTLSDMLSEQIGQDQHQSAEHYYNVIAKARAAAQQEQCSTCGNQAQGGKSAQPHQQQDQDDSAQDQSEGKSDAYKQGVKDGQAAAQEKNQPAPQNMKQGETPGEGRGKKSGGGIGECDEQGEPGGEQGKDTGGNGGQSGESGTSASPEGTGDAVSGASGATGDQPSPDGQGDPVESADGESSDPSVDGQSGDSGQGDDADSEPSDGSPDSGSGHSADDKTGEQAAAEAGLTGQDAADYAEGYEAGKASAQQGQGDGDQDGDGSGQHQHGQQSQQPSMGQPGGQCPDCGGTVPQFTGCGSGAGGPAAPGELGDDDLGGYAPGATQSEKDDVLLTTAAAIKDHVAKGRGTVPGSYIAEADLLLAPPTVPWQKVLDASVRRAYGKQSGKRHTTYKKRDRRRHNVRLGGNGAKVIYPGRYSPKLRILCIRDTSGSMGLDDLNDVGNEIVGISRSLGIKDEYLMVMDVDVVVHSVTPYRRVDSLREVHGRGGTDMCNGIAAALELNPLPDIIIVLSDGGTPWPQNPTPVPVIACLVSDWADATEADVPDWIRTVKVDRSKIRSAAA